MEPVKQSIWWFIKLFKIDELISAKTDYDSFWRVAIPRYRAYKKETYDYSISPSLKIVIDRSDYTQWRVFSGNLFINPDVLAFVKNNKKPLTIVDIGANIGAFSIMLANQLKNRELAIHFFEPQPDLLPTLYENVKRLTASDNRIATHVSDYAVGERHDKLKLNMVNGHSGIATLCKQDVADATVDVSVIPLDNYVEERKLNSLDFLKVDVEAFEPSVFMGAKQSISRFKPLIYFEYSREWFDNFSVDYIEEVIQFLIFNGYKFYREKKNSKLTHDGMTIDHLREFKKANYLAVAAR